MYKSSRSKNGKDVWLKLFTLEFLIVLLLLLSLITFLYAVRMVFVNQQTDFDDAVFKFIEPYITNTRTNFMLFITFLGKHSFLIPFNFLLIGYFIYKKRKWFAIRIAALSLSGLLLKIILKISFQRERPGIPVVEKVSGYSFPSGHALVGIVFYGLLVYVVWQEVKIKWLRYLLSAFFLILILLISFSRIYLRVHYASDVIAGLSIGFIWLILSLYVIGRIEKGRIARDILKGKV